MPIHDLENWMWMEACEILDRADRLHRHFFRPAVNNGKRPVWEPPIDVYETGDELRISVALPGVRPEHLKVKLEDNRLIIGGHRHLPASAASNIRRLEIPYGRFERRIDLHNGHFDISSCELENGCLLISLRKL